MITVPHGMQINPALIREAELRTDGVVTEQFLRDCVRADLPLFVPLPTKHATPIALRHEAHADGLRYMLSLKEGALQASRRSLEDAQRRFDYLQMEIARLRAQLQAYADADHPSVEVAA